MSNKDIVQQSADNAPVDLTAFDANYAAAEAATSSEVPDGKYRVRVEKVRLSQSPNGTSLLTWDLRILSGQYTGRHVFKRMAITPASLPLVKRDLLLLGFMAKLSSLPEQLNSLAGKTLSVTKRTKEDFVNIYFDKNL